MLQLRTGRAWLNGHHIEPVAVTRLPVASHPNGGRPGEGLTLLPAHRFDPGSELARAPGLHLDEGDQGPASDHEVDVVPSGAEPVCLDAPSERNEMCEDILFTADAKHMTWVGPFGHRDAFGSTGHDNKVGRTVPRSVIRFIRTSDEKMLITLVSRREDRCSAGIHTD